ncbi:hypothetical protein CCACVL1_01456, partial [Corchorus capsularis]
MAIDVRDRNQDVTFHVLLQSF